VSLTSQDQKTAGLYLHIPFCRAKCRYCDFASYAGKETLFGPYVAALLTQIDQVAQEAGWPPFDTLYVGGGTPTVLEPQHLCALVTACRSMLCLAADAEITSEANPGTVSVSSLRTLRAGGINRLSLGAQSLDATDLALLGRIHSPAAVLEAVTAARSAGFQNINLDLIYGLPMQSLATWQRTLNQVLALGPEHLSLYALTLEFGTPLAESVGRGELPTPDDDLAADMYALAQELLAANGYVQYEISNWARRSIDDRPGEPALACRHNLHYWRNEPYLGLGSSACSYDGARRYSRCADPSEYVRRVKASEDTVEAVESIDLDLEMDETMMLGLRLAEGVTRGRFRARFGVELGEVYATPIARLEEDGLLVKDAAGIRVAPNKYLVGNRVFAEFLRGL